MAFYFTEYMGFDSKCFLVIAINKFCGRKKFAESKARYLTRSVTTPSLFGQSPSYHSSQPTIPDAYENVTFTSSLNASNVTHCCYCVVANLDFQHCTRAARRQRIDVAFYKPIAGDCTAWCIQK